MNIVPSRMCCIELTHHWKIQFFIKPTCNQFTLFKYISSALLLLSFEQILKKRELWEELGDSRAQERLRGWDSLISWQERLGTSPGKGRGGLPCNMWVSGKQIHLVGQCQSSLPVLFIAIKSTLLPASSNSFLDGLCWGCNYLYIQLALFLQAVFSFFAQFDNLSLSTVSVLFNWSQLPLKPVISFFKYLQTHSVNTIYFSA